jgi:hypothetical protein
LRGYNDYEGEFLAFGMYAVPIKGSTNKFSMFRIVFVDEFLVK